MQESRLPDPIVIEYPPLFADFLAFERQVFGDPQPIALYDPYLIRYGEYRFILASLPLEPGVDVVDLGCETNLLMLFLAIRGANVIGLDLDPALAQTVEERKELVHRVTGVEPSLQFVVGDATDHGLQPASADIVVATSSIEHMFSDLGHGDQLAVDGIRRVLRPGGVAAITVPMSNGAPFHESPTGDERFAGPYRLYTPAALAERLLSNPQLRTVQHKYLAHTTPDPTSEDGRFHQFWLELTLEERLKWSWANPILSATFNPIVGPGAMAEREPSLNTALLFLRKKG
jgi:SAM-dependent methyltransferase